MTRSFANIEVKRSVEGSLAEERPISIPHGDDYLTGSVARVPRPDGVVLVANDGGCGRHSPAARRLSAELRRQGFATLLLDLLLPAEAGDPERAAWMKLEVEELARRIASARAWIKGRADLVGLPIALFGQDAGAAPVLLSAGARPTHVAAVVAGGARPDRIGIALESVRAPALLLVDYASGHLEEILRTHARLACRKEIAMMSERATPEARARAAADWIHAQFRRAKGRMERVTEAGVVPAL
jgi:putative phosphoribosyl transferase